ncbi:hypothetical protein [Amorphus sp. 3PC139-8]|uniref:hypothetical protein n=1 Tax=Amorphus sp. 3PC139-8 TaxID=2735676 RepID=UPI00345DF96A
MAGLVAASACWNSLSSSDATGSVVSVVIDFSNPMRMCRSGKNTNHHSHFLFAFAAPTAHRPYAPVKSLYFLIPAFYRRVPSAILADLIQILSPKKLRTGGAGAT